MTPLQRSEETLNIVGHATVRKKSCATTNIIEGEFLCHLIRADVKNQTNFKYTVAQAQGTFQIESHLLPIDKHVLTYVGTYASIQSRILA